MPITSKTSYKTENQAFHPRSLRIPNTRVHLKPRLTCAAASSQTYRDDLGNSSPIVSRGLDGLGKENLGAMIAMIKTLPQYLSNNFPHSVFMNSSTRFFPTHGYQ